MNGIWFVACIGEDVRGSAAAAPTVGNPEGHFYLNRNPTAIVEALGEPPRRTPRNYHEEGQNNLIKRLKIILFPTRVGLLPIFFQNFSSLRLLSETSSYRLSL